MAAPAYGAMDLTTPAAFYMNDCGLFFRLDYNYRACTYFVSCIIALSWRFGLLFLLKNFFGIYLCGALHTNMPVGSTYWANWVILTLTQSLPAHGCPTLSSSNVYGHNRILVVKPHCCASRAQFIFNNKLARIYMIPIIEGQGVIFPIYIVFICLLYWFIYIQIASELKSTIENFMIFLQSWIVL